MEVRVGENTNSCAVHAIDAQVIKQRHWNFK